MNKRVDWDEYLMGFARQAARRGSCDRKQVGAVIVVDKRVIATGYNGSVSGMPTCDDAGHDMQDGHCVRTVHAEMNALCQAAKHGVSVKQATIYVTATPCWACFRVLINAGIRGFIFDEDYRPEHMSRIDEVINEHAMNGDGIAFRRLSDKQGGVVDR